MFVCTVHTNARIVLNAKRGLGEANRRQQHTVPASYFKQY